MAYTPNATPGAGFSSAGGLSGFSGLASDGQSLNNLRAAAARDPAAATQEAARQFESLFMQELLKSMRQATLSSGMLDNEGTRLGTEMLDQQLATKLTGMPGGLSESIVRQLQRSMGSAPPDGPAAPTEGDTSQDKLPTRSGTNTGASTDNNTSANNKTNTSANTSTSTSFSTAMPARTAPASVPLVSIKPNLKPDLAAQAQAQAQAQRNSPAQQFVAVHQQAAKKVEGQTGIPATFMLAQAAHETGWGRKDIRMADGSSSNNLFGIKAGADWTGPVAEVTTTEYIDGVARKVKARFRAYANSVEAFADYARLMTQSPRYKTVMAQTQSAEGFAQGLQKAGYATDPEYAAKLSRVINTTLRLQRSLA